MKIRINLLPPEQQPPKWRYGRLLLLPVVLMLLVMGSMYKNKKLNYALIAAFAAIGLLAFALGRTQTPVGNKQFLRSMIPHHSSAIVMCQESSIDDPEIVELCGDIVETQEREIAQMKEILARLNQ